jgi:hypothetical protein
VIKPEIVELEFGAEIETVGEVVSETGGGVEDVAIYI